MFNLFGLGKARTKFGKWLDQEGITQLDLERKANLSRRTISRLCNDNTYRPKYETASKIRKGLKSLGKDVPNDFFWM
ncbi:helix-turn-helix domain-containing protein [Priestia megaterium]|uniref:helix-turn-helix domain-containing protein n=1 Tax=Priestia TaxID=2800373 RepID=UPI0021D68280|nr:MULTISPECIES: helix-turn-helix transcriptional regulator [Priestia]MCU7712608.1 helix-turn-helix domain-containing protein [Priestia megaterium]MCW1043812.1 helix-turn-helix domain-containing protein [Priestia sp. JV24]WJD81352.1 helix-turn-helix transcriptional regulator [Priestia megaterium]